MNKSNYSSKKRNSANSEKLLAKVLGFWGVHGAEEFTKVVELSTLLEKKFP